MLYVNPLTSQANYMDGATSVADAKRKTAFRELEQYFAKELLKELRASVKEEGIFTGGPAQEFFEDMRDDAMSADMARSGQLGIAKMLEDQMRIQDVRKNIGETEMDLHPLDFEAPLNSLDPRPLLNPIQQPEPLKQLQASEKLNPLNRK